MSDFVVGIDLGTSNCAVACVEPAQGPDAPIINFPVVQVRNPGDVGPNPLLPSAIYLPNPHEFAPEAIALPWEPAPSEVAGEFARWQGTRVPSRLIVSAKSWLSHSAIDRTADILPWSAPSDVRKMSPVAASSRLLQHMRSSWNFAHPDSPLEKQEVVITVPASFDAVARSLTVAAAQQAGMQNFTLVEEPQAAFYDFTARHRHELMKALEGVRLVLVVDVGGGTSDFTLVEVGEEGTLRRIAVGDHLMLGGDNMDAAIARKAEEQMLSGGRKLTAAQWAELLQASRAAKESLLGEQPPETYHVSVAGEGGRLIGSSISAKLSREDVERLVLDGFFPPSGADEPVRRGTRTALQEFGLPYAQDPAITRHLAAFVRAHAQAGRPDAVLLNGGVFNSKKLASRLVEIVSSWWTDGSQKKPIRLLAHESLELAVARGAAYHGLARRGLGRRIGGGGAHAFYVGLETKRDEEPKALCLIPRGHEEGQKLELGGRTFNLTLGMPVRFPLFTSTSERMALPGDIVSVEEDLRPLPAIHTVLKSAEAKTGRIPVHLRATLTEIGTLELWCVSESSTEQWRLEFELRGSVEPAATAVVESMPPRFSEARALVAQVFGGKSAGRTPASAPELPSVKQLWRGLEQMLGSRDQWRVPLLRELWSALYAGAGKRRRSADHERIWFQLAGYALRPGFGYPLDQWRSEQTASLFAPGVAFHKEKPVWIEFWIMWRRIAGGLNEQRHAEIWNYMQPHLERRLSKEKPKQQPKLKGIQPEGLDEMVRLAASLEHLNVQEKTSIGDWIVPRVSTAGPSAWALGRLGARVPLYGSVHKAVDVEKASEWLEVLFAAHAQGVEGALFAIVQLARLTGDRSRDIEDTLRARALDVLRESRAPQSWERLLQEVVTMDTADQARAFGDSLPAGLAA